MKRHPSTFLVWNGWVIAWLLSEVQHRRGVLAYSRVGFYEFNVTGLSISVRIKLINYELETLCKADRHISVSKLIIKDA